MRTHSSSGGAGAVVQGSAGIGRRVRRSALARPLDDRPSPRRPRSIAVRSSGERRRATHGLPGAGCAAHVHASGGSPGEVARARRATRAALAGGSTCRRSRRSTAARPRGPQRDRPWDRPVARRKPLVTVVRSAACEPVRRPRNDRPSAGRLPQAALGRRLRERPPVGERSAGGAACSPERGSPGWTPTERAPRARPGDPRDALGQGPATEPPERSTVRDRVARPRARDPMARTARATAGPPPPLRAAGARSAPRRRPAAASPYSSCSRSLASTA